ncbi:DUF4153 domain-containing protein [Deinococcus lacus]|uniref:DUF4153 domain-containing protein n=1 Tax=Deinococcus lacus TaxID=392561 RepID=A0ABW1YD71_9DEIO
MSPLVLAPLVMVGGAALLEAWPEKGRLRRAAGLGGQRALNLLTDAPTLFVLAALLSLLFYGLLNLAGALVAAVGISGVQEWLNRPYVAMPLVLGAAAFFVAALRSQTWGQGLTRTLSAVLGYLLPVASLVTLLFVGLLPVAALRDLGTLYEGFLSSYLYLTLAAVTVFLILHAFRDEVQPTLPPALATLTRFTAYLLPVFTLLALYGLNVRVGEYGLTESRVLGLSLAFWGLLLTLGLALTGRRPPFAGLGRILPPALGALLLIAGLLSVPGLRPADIALRSQVARLGREGLDAQQVQSSLNYVLGQGESGEAAVAGLDRAALPAASVTELERLDRLGAERYQLLHGAGSRAGLEETQAEAEAGVTLELAERSAPLSQVQRTALTRELEAWLKTSDPVPTPHQLCGDYPRRCAAKVYAVKLPGGGCGRWC